MLRAFFLILLTVSFTWTQEQSDVQKLEQRLLLKLDQHLQKMRRQIMQEVDRELGKIRKQFALEIENHLHRPAVGYLGVVLKPLSPEVRSLMDLQSDQGVLVHEVLPESTAAKAGIKRMDIVLKFAGTTVGSVTNLQQLIAKQRPGSIAEIELLRRGQKMAIKATLEASNHSAPKKKSLTSLVEEFIKNPALDKQKQWQQLRQLLDNMDPEARQLLESFQKQGQQYLEELHNNPEFKKQFGGMLESFLEQLGEENVPELIENLMREAENGDLLPLLEKMFKKPQVKDSQAPSAPVKPKSELDHLLDDLLDDSQTKPAAADPGIKVMPLPDVLRERENIPRQGVLVAEVRPQSPAAKSQIKKWDILLRIDHNYISSPQEFRKVITGYKAGDRLSMTLISRGTKRVVYMRLEGND